MGTELPLSRFRVLDLAAHRAGPTAVRQLADWGADVIKIEMPARLSQDSASVIGPRHAFDFQNLHRNKRSLTLNLKTDEGRDIFFRLARDADVVVENFRSDVKYRLGIDYEKVRRVNPRTVYGSISGFGQDGPYGNRPAVDQVAQGMGGLMSVTGLPGQGPVRVGIPIADLTAGMVLSQAILMALLDREVTGEGQWVHTSLLESLIQILDFQAARYLKDGEVPGQAGNNHPTSIPTGVFPTADGYINIAASGDTLWRRFCEAIDAPDLLAAPEYANFESRSRHRDTLNEAIAGYTRTRGSREWIDKLTEAGVPCGPIYAVDEVFADPQVRHLGIAKPVDHPTLGPFRLVGQAINLTRTPQPDRIRAPAPALGEHTDEILAELGYDTQAIADLRDHGVI